ncbi:DegV family EDD domain-containing protein [Moraxella bovis]|uniref:DegV family protein n=1 Tax=Moraxella bovis TaxID=476 RepID=UPI0022263257|nr:DegV family protein [Moraxella bovis]UYZ69247.1 DegV family EDD domain-containing protein [Moraxella bovis]UYZ71621.1 DegV family EDD domain-containing protein [Moraxella bovis]UYZ72465.1 DegV family EDD domain-containing protein [Moraxella bovis]UZA14916.1 DegV family EDD domain-containing protein [Moraxella bovis]UZA26723.1 DegV family EDD domain-containing protein [Moraxella bovis]
MKRIVLSTSSSSLNYINTPHTVRLVPFHVIIDGTDHLDIRDIDTARLSQMLYDKPNLSVKTSPPTADEINALFDELYAESYEEVLVCTISSAISKSHEIFNTLKTKFVGKMNIYVYDTKTLNIDEGALAFEADLMMQEGKSMLEIINRLDELRKNSLFMFTLSDLNFIVRNKKLSAPASMIANLFSIKPVLWMNDDGYIVVKDKVRKFERVMYHMADIITHQMGGQDAFVYIIDTSIGLHTNEFKNILAHDYGLRNVPVIPVSTVSLANHGPTGMGLGVYYGEVPRIFNHFK